MLESGVDTLQAAALERGSRLRRAQRAERILGLVLWVGFAAILVVVARH